METLSSSSEDVFVQLQTNLINGEKFGSIVGLCD